MSSKRIASKGFKLTEYEDIVLRKVAADFNMDISDLIRTCISIGLPVLQHVPFARRIQLEDNEVMKEKQ